MGRARDIANIINSGTFITPASASTTFLTQTSASTIYATVANFPASAWTSWTPTVRQGATTLSTSNNLSTYIQYGKLVFVKCSISITSTGSAGGRISITSPISQNLVPVKYSIGNLVYIDAGTCFYNGSVTMDGSDGRFYGIIHSLADYLGTTPSFTAANGDSVYFIATLEVL
jgi:hypothetical protein